jgi:hypothetical protein
MKETKLYPVTIAFKDKDNKDITAEKQAETMIAIGKEAVQEMKAIGFGYTFSANLDQTREAYKKYCNGEEVKINGGNQAAVVKAIQEQIHADDKDHGVKFRVLPIPTCLKSGGYGAVTEKQIIFSLACIACYLGAQKSVQKIKKSEHWVIFGWKNQITGEDFAIGGGVSGQLTHAQYNLIQSALKYFAQGDFETKSNETLRDAYPEIKNAYEIGEKEGDPLAYARIHLNDLDYADEEISEEVSDERSDDGFGFEMDDLFTEETPQNSPHHDGGSHSPLITAGMLGKLNKKSPTQPQTQQPPSSNETNNFNVKGLDIF